MGQKSTTITNTTNTEVIPTHEALHGVTSSSSFFSKTIMFSVLSLEMDFPLTPIGLHNGIIHHYDHHDITEEYCGGQSDGSLIQVENIRILEIIPDEILLHILEFLPLDCIGKLQRVSRSFLQYWTRFSILWKDLRAESPMLYMPPKMENYKTIKERIQKSIRMDDSVEIPNGVQLVVVGSSCCGKSILLGKAFCELPFSEEYKPSISMPILEKNFTFNNRNEYSFQIWDTYGNPKFRNCFKSAYSRANVMVYCFDLSCHQSFEELSDIYEACHVKKDMSDYTFTDRCVILLGLKSDLKHQVTRLEISNFLKRIEPEPKQKSIFTSKVQYFELSSKNDSSSDLLFPFLYALAILRTIY